MKSLGCLPRLDPPRISDDLLSLLFDQFLFSSLLTIYPSVFTSGLDATERFGILFPVGRHSQTNPEKGRVVYPLGFIPFGNTFKKFLSSKAS